MSGVQKQNQQSKNDAAAKKFVNDLISSNSKQLLNAYVYDFLIKSSLPQTAQTFIKEADVPTDNNQNKVVKTPPQKDLLPLAISMDAPQGFLYEWWQIFWDVFNARTHRGGSENAQHYYQLQLVRQRKEHALHSSTFHAAHAQAQGFSGMQTLHNPPNPQQQQQLLIQQQHQQQLLAQHRNQTQGQIPGQLPQHPGGATNVQAGPFGGASNFGAGAGAAIGGQFGQHQQHQQQQNDANNFMSPHSQPLQPSQTQQEVQQHFQQHQNQLLANQKRVNIPTGPGSIPPSYARLQQQQAQAQFQMNQMRQQQQQQFPQFQQFKAPTIPGPPYGPQPPTPVVSNGANTPNSTNNTKQRSGGASPNKKPKLDNSSNHPSPLTAGSPVNANANKNDNTSPGSSSNLKNSTTNQGNSSNPSPLINQQEKDSNSSSSTIALQDYQMQLMLLERENKRMLDGSKKDSLSNGNEKKKSPLNSKMPPPKKNLKNGTPSSSPAVGNNKSIENGTKTTANGRKKKEPAKRKSKKNAALNNNNNTSEPPTPTTPLTPNAVGNSNNNNNNTAAVKKESNLKEEKASSQLTPPNSENATNTNTDEQQAQSQQPQDESQPQEPTLSQSDDKDITKPSDEMLGGSQMLSGHNSHAISNDLYNDFPLSDFSNDLAGDDNFNLENFLNTDGGELSNFDSYWKDSVEATD
ncbi:hypothetical protein BN7_4293 [Wickerhamomyces ciferrii]|uniref:Uncharacterized protein n=1 Tax=Wickerhamomyces ciferrii (strain ATCC 14091 / BCRC 22168 / CBS 111 / JCM 3599 / NBRC 0793 / NRRL Y-1031 F-60-10) TaxID=1206466 RepID=K0KHP2_WICCF|nr:uncharacterized protein BN7_4293 [Wickerhamomyces ciferrii]CCH44725.1 hypothetical protein BN7_4293 [Wickerhamomyces ciferrii]